MVAKSVPTATVLGLFLAMGCQAQSNRAQQSSTPVQQRTGGWIPDGAGEQVSLWPEGVTVTAPEAKGPERTRLGTKGPGKPVVWAEDVSSPTMTIYRPKARNTGTALMVFPGGGYRALAMNLEGTQICEWATITGLTCVVLKYRVPQAWHHYDPNGRWLRQTQPDPFLPLQDAQRAMGLLRQRAQALGIDPHKIGVIGFSAGGHLVTAISNATDRSYKEVDAADAFSARPDFAMPFYPGHLWSDPKSTEHEMLDLFAFNPVRDDCPPTFLIAAEDDPVDDVRHSIAYFLALKAKRVPVEMHVYPTGGHGFAIRPTAQPVSRWPALAEAWLRRNGML